MFVQGALCPRESMSVWGSLSTGVSVQGDLYIQRVSVQGEGGLCLRVSVRRVSVRGVSVRETPIPPLC